MKGELIVMKKYIAPKINVCRFEAQDIITDSALVPTPATNYAPAEQGAEFNNSTYIFNWNE